MTLLALTGPPRSGKDTIAAHLCRHHKYTTAAFAAPLKKAASILLNRPLWQMEGAADFDREAILPEWGFSTRNFLQRFGTEAMRNNFGADFWVKRMEAFLADMLPKVPGIVITDCRFDNEAAMVRSLGGIVVEVKRPGCVASGHVSDKGVRADRYVYNDSDLEHLKRESDYLATITRQPAAVQP